MATRNWPTTQGFKPCDFQWGADTPMSSWTAAYTGQRQQISHMADRYAVSFSLAPLIDATEAGYRESYLLGLQSSGDNVRLYNFARPYPLGNLRGSPTVAADALAGARSVSLAGAQSGENLLRRCSDRQTYLASGWTTQNCTVTANVGTDPVGGNTAWSFSRTATGNHFVRRTYTMAATEFRTVTVYVWLKRGSYTDSVTLRIRDGADVEAASVSVSPSTSWGLYRLAGTFAAGSASNVRLYIDPDNDTGSAGQTVLVWNSNIAISSAIDTKCTGSIDTIAGPASADQNAAGTEVVRTASGNAYSAHTYITTAHAGLTYTFSVWLKSDTYTGQIGLFLRDGGGTQVGSTTCTITSTWTRFSVTGTFGSAPDANIVGLIDPLTDSGSVGEKYGRYGEMLNLGATAADYVLLPTLLGGDMLGSGNQLLQTDYPGATGDELGNITVPLALGLRAALTAASAVAWSKPTGLFQMVGNAPQMNYGGGLLQAGPELSFIEAGY